MTYLATRRACIALFLFACSSLVAANVLETYGKVALPFEPNLGQTDPRVKFLARGPGLQVFLSSTDAVYRLDAGDGSSAVRMALAGARRDARIDGLERLPGESHYLTGLDGRKPVTHVPHYGRVKVERVYRGIDLAYYGSGSQVEYDFIVAPGANPCAIAIDVEGARRLEIDAEGKLLIHTEAGSLVWKAPIAYQQRDGERRTVPSSYVMRGKNRVGFRVAAYDRSLPLVIDPILAYSTLLGGTGHDRAYAVAVDAGEEAVVTGVAGVIDFPTTLGAFDRASGGIFVTKLNAAGSALVYSTFLGLGRGTGVALRGGHAYVTGFTFSGSFATAGALNNTLPGASNAFVVKLKTDGSGLEYGAIVGPGFEGPRIAVDAAGNAYLAGTTNYNSFPTTPGAYQATRPTATDVYQGDLDVYLAKLNATGSALLYSTFLASTENDQARGIAVDGSGMAYVTGVTLGRTTAVPGFPAATLPFPTTSSAYKQIFTGVARSFVAKFDPAASGSASLVYSTFLSEDDRDFTAGIAVDGAGSAHVTGAGGQGGAFVTKLNAAGSALAYSATIAGAAGQRIALDGSNNAVVVGSVSSASEFVPVNGIAGINGGELFLARLDAAGASVHYSAYIEGHFDSALDVAVDPFDAVYVAGTALQSFTPTPGAFQGAFASAATEAFISKIVTNRAPIADAGPDQSVNVVQSFTLDGSASSDPDGQPLSYVWRDQGNTVIGNGVTLSHGPLPIGPHIFSLTVSDGLLGDSDAVMVTSSASLSLNFYGAGSGRVVSNDNKINCDSTTFPCSASYSSATGVTLTATPDVDSEFVGWVTVCSGTGLCAVTTTQNIVVGAQFDIQQLTLSVTRVGEGKVTSPSHPAIDCGTACSVVVAYNTEVELKATPDPGYEIAGWSDCSGASPTCKVTLQAAKTVTATFREITLTGISISPPSATAAIGEPYRFTLVGTFSDGTTRALSTDHSIEASDSETCYIRHSGIVKCWGQVFPPATKAAYYRAAVLAAGSAHTCAIVPKGAGVVVQCESQEIAGTDGAITIAAAGGMTCALMPGGIVRCWTPHLPPYSAASDTAFAGVQPPAIVPIDVGADGASAPCVLLSTGAVSCFGGASTVAGVTDAVAVSIGVYHACALLADGRVKCWGDNDHGQLGRGTIDLGNIGSMSHPADFVLEWNGAANAPITDAIGIMLGDYYACALMANTTVKCWGAQYTGGSAVADSPLALTVKKNSSVLTGVAAVAAGAFHACAVMSDGTANCWGNNLGQTLLGLPPLPFFCCTEQAVATNAVSNALAAASWGVQTQGVRIMASGRAIATTAGAKTVTASIEGFSASATLNVVNTPTGSSVTVTPIASPSGTSPVAVTFASVSQSGETAVVINPGVPPGAPTTRFELGNPSVYYDISTTALYTAPVTICISYAGVNFNGSPKLYHFEGQPATPVDITTTVDTAGQIVCGEASSLSPFALMVPANSAPIARAGPDATLECSAPKTSVTLDGSGSSDADGDPLTYDWTGIFGSRRGATATVDLPLGVTTATLTVSDGRASASDTMQVTVRDTAAPKIAAATASPSVLWPPNHKMIPVAVSVSASDRCDPAVRCRIESVASNEPENGQGDGDTSPDWEITGALTLKLRAERSGGGNGRVYSIGLRCVDASGNGASRTIAVTVPSQR
ncbi:MAG: DUF7948 domain-containing protein [Usitatibacter sp.]